ncbi:MAG: guanylate kinase [Oscillospiraceae bacterium]|nr:guanylate kinase [Oscillospiraceae bacterium]
MKMTKGVLYVFSAPSGCGKGTVLTELRKRMPELKYSVSATTRAPRDGEVDGVHYYFVTRERFDELVETGGMLEHATFCGNSYGTPKEKVFECLDNGIDVILEIETKGAMMVKESYPEAVMIFMLPPSIGELRRRLENRHSETEEVIDGRVKEAAREIAVAENYDYVFVNDDVSEAVETLYRIMTVSKNLVKINQDLIKGVLDKC